LHVLLHNALEVLSGPSFQGFACVLPAAAGMVFCDRHFGGINYPLGGVGLIGEEMADGITARGGHIVYKANVKEIITEPLPDTSSSSSSSSSSSNGASTSGSSSGSGVKATGVRLADGRVFRGKVVISNATRWDTFEGLVGQDKMPESEKLFRCVCGGGGRRGDTHSIAGRPNVICFLLCVSVAVEGNQPCRCA
jgi:phytoene dehydrogenase-like protein